jgi:3-hydroxybutyryl-CoA dehydrogenase
MKVGIVGYGKMGRGIFSLLIDSHLEAAVLVRDSAKADRNNRRLEKRLRRALDNGRISQADLSRRLGSLGFTSAWNDLGDCDLIIETVTEDLETKIQVLRQVEQTASPDAVIASNTSSLSIGGLGKDLNDPGRFCGLHFFHPTQLTTVVEIIASAQTTFRTVSFLQQVSRGFRRTPLVVKDGPGSPINAILNCLICEALYILEQGLALPSQIDALVGRFARIGPCESLDGIGIELFTEGGARLLEACYSDFVFPELPRRLVRDGRLGRQSGRGIYQYEHDRPVDDHPDYYVNPGQTHSLRTAPGDEASLHERLLFPTYVCLLKLARMGLGELGDLCLGIRDVIGMKIDPESEMRKLGSNGLRDVFDRLRREVGPRYDCRPLEGIMARLNPD